MKFNITLINLIIIYIIIEDYVTGTWFNIIIHINEFELPLSHSRLLGTFYILEIIINYSLTYSQLKIIL